MNKLFSLLIIFSLFGCNSKLKNSTNKNIIPLSNEKYDIIQTNGLSDNKVLLDNSLDYSSVPTNVLAGSIDNKNNAALLNDEYLKKKDVDWLSKLRKKVVEFDVQACGSPKPLSMFDIRNIPIGFSYKIELDKPKKKVKLMKCE